MLSRSPSPVSHNDNGGAVITPQQIIATCELINSDNEPSPQSPHGPATQGSPKHHSPLNNTLNPLKFLTETSLATRKTSAEHNDTLYPRSYDDTGTAKVGVVSEVDFEPGQSSNPEPMNGAQPKLSRSNQHPTPSEAVRRKTCTARYAELHDYRRHSSVI